MFPILLQLGPFTIYSLWVLAAVGFLMAFVIMNKLLQKDRNSITFLANHSLAIFFAAIIMARIFFVVQNFKVFFEQLDLSHLLSIFYIWDKGLSFWGGITGIVLALVYFCRKEKENIAKWLDIMTISALGGMVFGNIGAFLDGSNYGNETDLPWGVVIENSRYAVPIHPVQIYAAIYCLLIAVIIWNLWNHPLGKQEGNATLFGIGMYSVFRFMEEFLRGDESNYFLGLRETQIYCIIALAIIGTVLYLRFGPKKTAAHAPHKT